VILRIYTKALERNILPLLKKIRQIDEFDQQSCV